MTPSLSEPHDALTRLEDCVASTLEAMFFESLAAPPHTGAPPEDCWCSSVRFHGSCGGRILVAAQPIAIRMLTGNFLPPGDSLLPADETAHMVLAELCNIICGSLVSSFAPGGDLRLEAPRLENGPLPAEGWAIFPIDAGCVAIRVELDGALP